MPRMQRFEGHFRVADHDRQQVIEVMRDAAGQLADAFELLGLAELGFEILLLGQIDDEPEEAALVGGGQIHAGDQHRNAGAVFVNVSFLEGGADAGFVERLERETAGRKQFGGRQTHPCHAGRGQFFARIAENAEEIIVGFENTGVVRDENTDDIRVEEAPEALVDPAQFALGAFLFGNDVEGEDTAHRPAAEREGGDGDGDVDGGAVFREEHDFHLMDDLARDHRLVHRTSLQQFGKGHDIHVAKQFTRRFCLVFLQRKTEDAPCFPIDEPDAAVDADQYDGIGAVFREAGVQLQLILQGLFGAFGFRDIADHAHEPNRAPVFVIQSPAGTGKPAHFAGGGRRGAIFGGINAFAARLQRTRNFPFDIISVLGVNDLQESFIGRLLYGRNTERGTRASAPDQGAGDGIEVEHARAGGIEREGKPGLAVAQAAAGLIAFGARGGFAEVALHGDGEAGQIILHDVVAGAGAQHY